MGKPNSGMWAGVQRGEYREQFIQLAENNDSLYTPCNCSSHPASARDY